MKLRLSCFFPAAASRPKISPEQQQHVADELLLLPPPPPPPSKSANAPVECGSSPIRVLVQQATVMRRLELPPAVSRDSLRVSSSRMGLRDKMRDLGDILHSIDTRPTMLSRGCGGPEVYRRNWLESDFPAIKDNLVMLPPVASSPRLSSVRSTPRSCSNVGSYAANLQLGKLEAMLRSTEDKPATDAAYHRDLVARLSRIEDKVKKGEACPQNRQQHEHEHEHEHKNNNKAMAAAFYESMKSFASRVEEHLKRSDVAMRKVERKVQRLSSVRKKSRPAATSASVCCSHCTTPAPPTTPLVHHRAAAATAAAAGVTDLTCDDKLTNLEHKLTVTRAEVERVLATADELRKKSEENHVDVKLCWSAMNQLCIDNETFRRELQQHRSCLQRVAQLVE